MSAQQYHLVYTFTGFRTVGQGWAPHAGLLNVNGTLYGTTYYGGNKLCPKGFGCGTVFSITPSGAEVVLHIFAGPPDDGGGPAADLINVNGTLYGTTYQGGPHRKGTVFSITPSGTETVLYSFGSTPNDGANPVARLLDVNGTLYGTTPNGGASSYGTVFSVTTSGAETVLHSFQSNPKDGASPQAPLVSVNGTLYGTTTAGGIGNEYYGTVFAITPSGSEAVLYTFGRNKGDGVSPFDGLVDVKGTLYGTTTASVIQSGQRIGGTFYAITTSGKETVLHTFGLGSDGANPMADLTDVKGTLYGTTYLGGSGGLGTVFAMTTSGKETVLHSFSDKTALHPGFAILAKLNGTLYGTTPQGSGNGHYGTASGVVYALTP